MQVVLPQLPVPVDVRGKPSDGFGAGVAITSGNYGVADVEVVGTDLDGSGRSFG